MRKFSINVDESVLADLRDRLDRAVWPDEPDGGGWDQGTDLTYLRELVAYWRDGYDWAAAQARLNAWPQLLTDVDGVTLHAVHVTGRGPRPLPIILTHGWPSTFAEFLGLIPALTDPGAHGGDEADAFDVVIPSIPGFGFSSPYTRPGPRRVHDLWASLMTQFGYERFGACGSDIGARVTSRLGWYHPDRLIGIHLSSVDLEWPDPLPDDLSDEEKAYVARCEAWDEEEGGYAAIQRTRPQSLAYGLADSPVGLAAWIVEKYRAWMEAGTELPRDELLTTITLYWVTRTIGSANRWYHDAFHDPNKLKVPLGTRIEVPSGIAMFPGETQLVVPREFAQRSYNVQHWTDPPRGGHFPAIEAPELLIEDIRAFFRPLR